MILGYAGGPSVSQDPARGRSEGHVLALKLEKAKKEILLQSRHKEDSPADTLNLGLLTSRTVG